MINIFIEGYSLMGKHFKYIRIVVAVLSAFLLTGCIPPNEHVGKPAAHSYKDGYYNSGYYGDDGYYYYYR